MINRRINRRRFLQATAGAAALAAWPRRAYPFAQSPRIRKFLVGLPGLTPAGANAEGNYIPVLKAVTPSPIAGTDVYEIDAAGFEQQLHPDLPTTTKFWGYADLTVTPVVRKYLGGVIVAKHGVPVQLRITNNLPPLHILPNDITLIDPASGEAGTAGRGDRLAVHLHGGRVF